MNILQFMSDSPILTFFLFLIVADMVINVAQAFKKPEPKKPVKPMMVK